MKKDQDIKVRLHKLIDRSENEHLLQIIYEILENLPPTESIRLTKEQEQELNKAYKESFDESELISVEDLSGKKQKVLTSL